MEMLEMLKTRRTIRKFTEQKVEREKLEKIAEAGLYAPNAGGGQGTKIIMIEDFDLIRKIGIFNANCENRNWNGRKVNDDQPSIIDDLTIVNGFYDCQALAIVCIPKERYNMVNGIGTGFTCLENMVMEAYSLGVDSCIVGRAEATFKIPEVQDMYQSWGVDESYQPLMFLCMGYIRGGYPEAKPRKENRVLFVK